MPGAYLHRQCPGQTVAIKGQRTSQEGLRGIMEPLPKLICTPVSDAAFLLYGSWASTADVVSVPNTHRRVPSPRSTSVYPFAACKPVLMAEITPALGSPPLQYLSPISRVQSHKEPMPSLPDTSAWVIRSPWSAPYLYVRKRWM